MNFNFTHSNEYSLNNSLICECIKLYGIEAKLLKTEKINLDKEVFGDWSSIKTNSSDVLRNDERLMTISMKTKYGGVQMDADQDLDLEEVTEMTQMISSLAENGHYSDLVNQIYSDLGRVVAKHMEKYVDKVDILTDNSISEENKQKAYSDLYQLLGESLVIAFSSGRKDTLGLAQAFVQKATEAIRNKKEFNLPFSAATINGAFISDIASSINKGGIRHKYDGLSGVLNPSFNMIQYYRIYNAQTNS